MKYLHEVLQFVLGLSDRVKAVIDTVSLGTVLATLLNSLPHIAAALSVIWGAIHIYETQTVQKWLQRREAKKGKVRAA